MDDRLIELSKKILGGDYEQERFCKGKENEFEELAHLLNSKNKRCILLFGINPAGNEDSNCKFYYEYVSNEKMRKSLNKTNTTNNKYFKPNYELFDSSQISMKWIFRNREDLNNDFDDFDEDYYNEELKKKFVLIFCDLIYYHDTDMNNIRNKICKVHDNKIEEIRELNIKEELKQGIKDMIDKHIEIFDPALIVVTNSFASQLICGSLFSRRVYSQKEYKQINILFSGSASGGNMDIFSKERLKNDIANEMKKIK